MSDGSRYLNCGVMGFNYGSLMQFRMIHLELTDCRISVQVYPRIIAGSFLSVHHDLFVWDWRTGKKYLVSHTIFPLGTNESYAFVKGAHSNANCNRSFHRRVPTHWYSSPRRQRRIDVMGYLKQYPKRFYVPPWTNP